ncbi:Na(+)/H(+) antiporter subunit C1 [Oxobacter pfennigii]|uniref:Na(+)/H(+) antiporter subunit C1 n=1 Tax=Oxobacter pfennigii TaxID=36849 RepID=A0A0P8WJG9_9CLOT|nr:cation:proton antiporter subunit C [Oxobacter pfennigii]KPU42302.1 Na(+)/H(+) antiporter subunit C1 [Oxobacter pfennigii]
MDVFFNNYFETAAMILFGIGFTTLLLNSNLIKKIIGFNIMDMAIFLFFIARGYIEGRDSPIIVKVFKGAEGYINPVPSALILTGIVVSVSTTAFALALTLKLHEQYGTVDIDEISNVGEE